MTSLSFGQEIINPKNQITKNAKIPRARFFSVMLSVAETPVNRYAKRDAGFSHQVKILTACSQSNTPSL